MIGRSPKTADRSDHQGVTLAQKFYGVLGSRPLGPWIGTNKAGMTTVTARWRHKKTMRFWVVPHRKGGSFSERETVCCFRSNVKPPRYPFSPCAWFGVFIGPCGWSYFIWRKRIPKISSPFYHLPVGYIWKRGIFPNGYWAKWWSFTGIGVPYFLTRPLVTFRNCEILGCQIGHPPVKNTDVESHW